MKVSVEQLREWVNAGSRSAEIKITNHSHGEQEETCWCFDFDLMSGKFINDASELPTKEELQKKLIADAEKRLKELKERQI